MNQAKKIPVEKKVKLTAKQKSELKRKRKVFRDLYLCFENDNTYEAEIELKNLEATIDSLFVEHMNIQKKKILFKDICKSFNAEFLKTNGLENHEIERRKKLAYIMSILENVTVEEAATYAFVVNNAIDQCRRYKNRDVTVKDLDIEMLPIDLSDLK